MASEESEAVAMPVAEFTVEDLKVFTNGFTNPIAEGSQGTVFRGQLGDTDIAVKMCRIRDGNERQQWLDEIRFLSAFNHPNVVQLLGHAEDVESKKVFLVYPFYTEGSLQAKLQDLDWVPLLHILRGIASGLEHIHTSSLAVVHGDLKPANILLDNDQNPIICDFGLAVQVGNKLQQSTPEYADTNFFGKPAMTISDVYSFGVLVMICLAEKDVSRGKKHMMNLIAGQHIKYEFEDNSKLKDLIDKRLSKTGLQKSQVQDMVKLARNCTSSFPRDRPTTAAAIITTLDHVGTMVVPPKKTLKAKLKGLFK